MGDAETVMRPVRRGRLRWWGWVLIAFAVAIPVVGLGSYAVHSLRETSPDQPFVAGALQQPEAVSPLVCEQRCFNLIDAMRLEVSAEDVAPLSLTDERSAVGELEPSTVDQVAPMVGESWRAVGGDELCGFLGSNAPYMSSGPDSASTDPIGWVQVWAAHDEVMDIAAREFPTSSAAAFYIRDVHHLVPRCEWQDVDTSRRGGSDSSLLQITAPAAIDVPAEVAAIGWVREGDVGPRWRSYVWLLQRGNLVVQVRVLTDGRILEPQVADFAELVAVRLGRLAPERLDG